MRERERESERETEREVRERSKRGRLVFSPMGIGRQARERMTDYLLSVTKFTIVSNRQNLTFKVKQIWFIDTANKLDVTNKC